MSDRLAGFELRDALILAGLLITLTVLFLPRLRRDRLWRATVTPLASIIGSGFLVLGPILESSYGYLAPVVMLVLCVVAWLFGGAIRLNIAARAEAEQSAGEVALDRAASWVLAFAYVISVAYYLNLFGAFGVSLTAFDTRTAAQILTTAVFILILAVGWFRGFSSMERMEQFTVSLKLAIIVGLLVGLGGHFLETARGDALIVTPPNTGLWAGVTLAMGLIVTVQGFETSRYLGEEYSAQIRIRSMRLSQLTSTAIYMIYVGLLTFSLPVDMADLSETAIIDITARVAMVLPPLLVAAAIAAQFSAAVADTAGAGGLIGELTGGRIRTHWAYAILTLAGLGLTWGADVFQIISYASRAFAAYYAIQSAIACLAARRGGAGAQWWHAGLYGAMALVGVAITLLGRPVE